MKLNCQLNGRDETVEIEPHETLLDTIRDKFHLTATKEGCREGECGACTVLVDGEPVDSCIFAAAAAEGRSVETVEGLGSDVLSHVQSAMVDNNGVQCGFCTPGFVVMITALLRRHPNPSDDLIAEALSGNICRCTGYTGIFDAVNDATRRMREDRQ